MRVRRMIKVSVVKETCARIINSWVFLRNCPLKPQKHL